RKTRCLDVVARLDRVPSGTGENVRNQQLPFVLCHLVCRSPTAVFAIQAYKQDGGPRGPPPCLSNLNVIITCAGGAFSFPEKSPARMPSAAPRLRNAAAYGRSDSPELSWPAISAGGRRFSSTRDE